MKQVENQYPMLLIPKELISIIEDNDNQITNAIVNFKIGGIPVKPTSPKIIAKPYPPYLSSSNIDSAKFNLYFFLGISAFVVIYLTINEFSEMSVFFSIVIYSIPALIFLFRTMSKYSAYVEDKNRYKIEYQSYVIDIQNYNKLIDDYNLKVNDYETKLELYNTQLTEYEKKKSELLISNEYNTLFNKIRKEYINKLINEFSQKITKPQKSDMDFTVGISENYFQKYLNNYFKDIIVLKHYILDYYEPDFTLVLENGLHIDIEIDEPYSGNTKEIIHYYDKLKKEFSDNSRNNYFLSNGWVVIRFSEQQIIEQPDSCCKFIAKTFHYFNHNFDIEIFNQINEITPMNIWSKKEANEMAYFDYRKKYLNEDIIMKQ